MEAKELRIGNFINNGEFGIGTISSIDFDNVELEVTSNEEFTETALLAESTGIQLTEEWLIKFGFIKDEYQAEECGEGVGDLYILNNFMICKKENSFYNYIEIDGDKFYSFCSTELTSVHKLQNLFYAITTTELTYEMES